MPDTTTLLDELVEQRDNLRAADTSAIEAREGERKAYEARDNKTADDVDAFLVAESAYIQASDKRETELKVIERRVKEQKTLEKRREAAARAAAETVGPIPALDGVRSEPLTYRRDNSRTVSYFADLANNHSAAKSHMLHSQTSSKERLERHATEMSVEIPKIEKERERRATKEIERSVESRAAASMSDPFRRFSGDRNPFTTEQRVTPNRTDGYGGYFVPPMWWNDYIKGLRPSRVTANLCKNFDMPSGTDVIVVPKLSNLTTVGVQGADNSPVTETDWSDTAVVAPVKTLAGMSDVPIQLLEQSPYPVDQMVIQDLLADYDKQFDLQIIQGSGSVSNSVTPTVGGQVAGLYSSAGASNWTSYNGITYTDSTMTSDKAWKLFSVFGAMASKVAQNRFLFDDTFNIVVHPRRAWWFASGTDSNNRPIVESSNFGPFNVAAVEPGSVPAQGLVTQLPWGHRIYASANIPTTDTAGSGSAQDIAIGFLGSDAWVFEGQMHTDVFPELLSGTLAVRFRVYAYAAFLLRYGQSLAIASGTGFSAPEGAVSSVLF